MGICMWDKCSFTEKGGISSDQKAEDTDSVDSSDNGVVTTEIASSVEDPKSITMEVHEAIKKTLPHILDEIEGLNISVAALHQQIKSMKTTLKILGKEHDVVHKVMVEQIFDLKNTLRYNEGALCYIT